MQVQPTQLVFGRLKRGHSYALEIKVSTADGQSVDVSVVGGTPACLRLEADTWARPGIVQAVVQAREAGRPFVGSIRCIAYGATEITVPVSAHVMVDPSAELPNSLHGMIEELRPEVRPLSGASCVGAIRIQSEAAGTRPSFSRLSSAAAHMRPSAERSGGSESTPTTTIDGSVTGGLSVAGKDPAAYPDDRHVTAHANAVLMEEKNAADQRVWWAPFNGAFEGYLDALQRSLTVVQRQVRSMQCSTSEMRTLNAALEDSADLFEAVRSGSRRQRESIVSQEKVPRQIRFIRSGKDTGAPPAAHVDAATITASQTAAAAVAIAIMQQKLEEMVNSNNRLQLAVAEEHEMRMRVENQRDKLRAEMLHTRGRNEGAASSTSDAIDSAVQETTRLRNDLEDARERIDALLSSEKEATEQLKLAEYNLEAKKRSTNKRTRPSPSLSISSRTRSTVHCGRRTSLYFWPACDLGVYAQTWPGASHRRICSSRRPRIHTSLLSARTGLVPWLFSLSTLSGCSINTSYYRSKTSHPVATIHFRDGSNQPV